MVTLSLNTATGIDFDLDKVDKSLEIFESSVLNKCILPMYVYFSIESDLLFTKFR